MTFEEEVEDLKRDFQQNPDRWRGIPYEAAFLYMCDLVRDPDDIREYMRRHIPPTEAGDDRLGMTSE